MSYEFYVPARKLFGFGVLNELHNFQKNVSVMAI